MTVSDLLLSQPRWGHTRCRKFLAGIPMSETKVISSMTERQRMALHAVLGRPRPGNARRGQSTSLTRLSKREDVGTPRVGAGERRQELGAAEAARVGGQLLHAG